jgi:hypothetical protein
MDRLWERVRAAMVLCQRFQTPGLRQIYGFLCICPMKALERAQVFYSDHGLRKAVVPVFKPVVNSCLKAVHRCVEMSLKGTG